MLVSDLMSRPLTTIGTRDSCLEAVARMHDAKVRHLPVVNQQGLLVGIVTDRDLRHHLFSPHVYKDLGSIPVDAILKAVAVAEIMSTRVITVAPEDDLKDAAQIMAQEKVGSLPVVDGGGRSASSPRQTSSAECRAGRGRLARMRGDHRVLSLSRSGRRRAKRAEEADHAGLHLALEDVHEAHEQVDHARVVCEDVGGEPPYAPRAAAAPSRSPRRMVPRPRFCHPSWMTKAISAVSSRLVAS